MCCLTCSARLHAAPPLCVTDGFGWAPLKPPTLQAAGPSTPNGQVTASGRAQRAAAAAAGAAWGSPRVGHVREREEAATSSAKRRRVQTALFRDDDEPPR